MVVESSYVGNVLVRDRAIAIHNSHYCLCMQWSSSFFKLFSFKVIQTAHFNSVVSGLNEWSNLWQTAEIHSNIDMNLGHT